MKEIAAALAKAQAEMGPALKDSTNPAFKSKYADLASVMAACIPALNKNGIAVVQPPCDDESGRYVKTILLHTSGETLECRVPLIVGKNDMQGYGSAVTYGRRYGLMSMAGIAPEDDDGNAAAKAAPLAEAIHKGIDDGWRDGVLDSIPANASPREKAEAFATFFCDDFARQNGVKALSNRWARYQATIEQIATKHADLRDRIVDAFENRKNELTDATAERAA